MNPMNIVLTCIIVDDEPIARKSMETLCQKSANLDVQQICKDASEALIYLEENSVDLIFLDVEMPGISGLELLDKIGLNQQVILTTSKIEYAFEAFSYNVTDYLKKPISFPRFEEAVRKALEVQKSKNISKTDSVSNEIYVRVDGKLVRLLYEDILYFENAGDYVCIVTTSGNYIIHGTITNIDSKLPKSIFMKVHRSYIVNLTKIKDIEESTLVIDKKVIPISRAHKNLLFDQLNLL